MAIAKSGQKLVRKWSGSWMDILRLIWTLLTRVGGQLLDARAGIEAVRA